MDAKDEKLLMPLSKLRVGERALIVAFSVDTGQGERIRDMGLVPGEILEVVRILEDRIEVKIGKYFLALGKEESEHIKVKPFL